MLWRKGESGEAVRASVSVANNQRVRQVRVGRRGSITAGTDDGRLYHWVLEEQPRLADVVTVAEEPITALEYLIGGTSLVVGTKGGGLSSWFPAAVGDGAEHMVRGHSYESQGAAVVALGSSPRDRSFAAVGADGSLVVRHQTSERTLARRKAGPAGRPAGDLTEGRCDSGGRSRPRAAVRVLESASRDQLAIALRQDLVRELRRSPNTCGSRRAARMTSSRS